MKTRKWILHVHCSLLFEASASLKEVQDRLGHSDVNDDEHLYTRYKESESRSNTAVC